MEKRNARIDKFSHQRSLKNPPQAKMDHEPMVVPIARDIAPNCLLDTVTIEPQSVKLVSIAKPSRAIGEEVLVSPSDEIKGEPYLLMAETLNRGEGRQLVVPIFNSSTKPVTIREGTKLTKMEPLHDYTLVKHPKDTRNPWEKLQLILRNKQKSPENVQLFKEWLMTQEGPDIEILRQRKVDVDSLPVEPEERGIILKLMIQYIQVFAKDSLDLGETHLTKHRIDTGDTKPIKQRPHKTPFALREIMDKACKDMYEQGVIEDSQSPWASPVVLQGSHVFFRP